MLNPTMRIPRSRLTPNDVVSIRLGYQLGLPIRYIARNAGLPPMTVLYIAHERTHVAITSPLSIYERITDDE